MVIWLINCSGFNIQNSILQSEPGQLEDTSLHILAVSLQHIMHYPESQVAPGNLRHLEKFNLQALCSSPVIAIDETRSKHEIYLVNKWDVYQGVRL